MFVYINNKCIFLTKIAFVDEGSSKNKNQNNEGSKTKSSKPSADVKMRKPLPKINLKQNPNTESELTNESAAESEISTDGKAEKMQTDSENTESVESDESKLPLPPTRNKRPKGTVIQAELTPTEKASPPKFKYTPMETS